MRPEIPDDLADDIDLLVESRTRVNPSALDFADKLRLLLPKPQQTADDTGGQERQRAQQARESQQQRQQRQQTADVDVTIPSDPFVGTRRRSR